MFHFLMNRQRWAILSENGKSTCDVDKSPLSVFQRDALSQIVPSDRAENYTIPPPVDKKIDPPENGGSVLKCCGVCNLTRPFL